MNLPPMILFINADIDGYTTSTISTQLYLDGYISKSEFDAQVEAIPSYPDIVHANNLRIMVILPNFRDYVNRDLADVVAFYSHGLLNIEKNKFGPPNFSLALERINPFALLRAVESKYVVVLPHNPKFRGPPCDCNPYHYYQPLCDCHRVLGGIFAIESTDTTGVHLPSCDNEYNNEAFINRK